MSSDSGDLAADIISYIGIPLAVLGVVPIFYTSINSIITAYNIRRRLRKNAIALAATRSSMLSGVVEVEFPRLSLTPLDREDPEYWTLNRQTSNLKGGSWTALNWNKLVVGRRSYRVQYSADIQEPQAEVDFNELLSFLIDRGAVPDPKGFKLLNIAGLWTPSNTTLLRSPDLKESALRVTFPEDSDGLLSLALQWDPEWRTGHTDSLPPHWVRLRDHTLPARRKSAKTDGSNDKTEPITPSGNQPSTSKDDATLSLKEKSTSMADKPGPADQSAAVSDNETLPTYSEVDEHPIAIRLQLGTRENAPLIGQVMADSKLSSDQPLQTSTLACPHIHEKPCSEWLPTFCTALGSLNGASIWTISLPIAHIRLSQRDTLPGGVMEMAGILLHTEVAQWGTQYDPNEQSRQMMARMQRSSQARTVESRLPPAQRDAARMQREAEERNEMMRSMMDRSRIDRERAELKEREAVESRVVSTESAAKGVLRKLRNSETRKNGGDSSNDDDVQLSLQVKEGPWRDLLVAAETVLHMMLTDSATATKICGLLDKWCIWSERGGMTQSDFDFVMREDAMALCYAIVLMAMLKEESSKKESNLALDLQECVTTWKRVRLG